MRALVAALAFFALAAPLSAQERDWQVVRDAKGVYAATLPGKADSYGEKHAEGEASGHNLEIDKGAHYFDLYWTDTPKAPRDNAAQAGFLRARVEASVASANGTIVSYRPVALGGFVGSETVVDFPSMGGRLRQRLYIVDQRVVHQTWSGPPGSESSADVEKFFESLRLKP